MALECVCARGAVHSSEELHGVRVKGERPIAMGSALNLLGYRACSEAEIRDRLTRYGYAGETIEGVVLRLQELAISTTSSSRMKAREKAVRTAAGLGRSQEEGVGEALAREVVEEEFAGRSEVEEARSAPRGV